MTENIEQLKKKLSIMSGLPLEKIVFLLPLAPKLKQLKIKSMNF